MGGTASLMRQVRIYHNLASPAPGCLRLLDAGRCCSSRLVGGSRHSCASVASANRSNLGKYNGMPGDSVIPSQVVPFTGLGEAAGLGVGNGACKS